MEVKRKRVFIENYFSENPFVVIASMSSTEMINDIRCISNCSYTLIQKLKTYKSKWLNIKTYGNPR